MRATADLPATPDGPGLARTIVADTLARWGLTELREDAVLITSELVTNAAQHAPGSDTFRLEVTRRAGGVRISLADGNALFPAVQQLDADRPSGRGMRIVESLAARWGTEKHHDGGKRVWVDLDASQP